MNNELTGATAGTTATATAAREIIALETDIGTIVRNWVHYDNLANTLSRQTTTARNLRDQYELKLWQLLKDKNAQNAVIQISGGRLNFQEEKKVLPITYERLQDGLQGYFKSGGKPDETAHIMGYLRKHKTIETKTRLKKIGSALPKLPDIK
jgi:hypothetical protein